MKPPGFWYHSPTTLGGQILQAALTPLGYLYGLVGAHKLKKVGERVPAAVICVGNLTLGGTGKTPITSALIEALNARGLNAQGLSRGYGGRLTGPVSVDIASHNAADVGDEPLILAKSGTIWVSRNRVAGAYAAVNSKAEIIVMDDGHQNPSLEKDYSILVIDAEAGWGNGRIFPGGPLREKVSAGVSRADALILMTPGESFTPDYEALGLADCEQPILRAWLSPLAPPPEGKLFAFAGIGRPEKFFNALVSSGGQLVANRAFPDHHPFKAKELRQLRKEAEHLGAQLITTEKDYVRLPAGERKGIAAWPVGVRFADEGALQTLLDRALERGPARGKPVE